MLRLAGKRPHHAGSASSNVRPHLADRFAVDRFVLPGLPSPLTWRIEPPEWHCSEGALTVTSGPLNDYFHDPATGKKTATAPCALLTIDEPSFVLSTHAELNGPSTFDAAVLFVSVSEDIWAKFCLETSPQGDPTIVSVVTRDVSDDCNSVSLASASAYLRLAKTPRTLAFHYSLDGRYWRLARYFSLGVLHSVSVGLVAQSPLGAGSRVRFGEFAYRAGELPDLRDGR